MASISIKGVSKSYGSHPVLKGLDLDVDDGEFVSYLGPSGCGKSTLLYLLGLLDSADEGRIWIGGAEVSGLPDPELTR
ncbi:MAG: putative sugar transporter, ATP-binding protein, partial [Rhodopila sp.]|nr:putative sugar transporter, ATP-binding protein [Rhodopila sp.]